MIGLGIARFFLGLGEAGNFPAAIKAVAEWFPRQERAFATGIFNAGTNVGATLAPFAVGFLLYRFGWRYAFLSTTVFAAAWLVIWLRLYRLPAVNPRVSVAERAYILQETPAAKEKQVSWRASAPASPDVGLPDWQGSHRSSLVVLSLLAAGSAACPVWVDTYGHGPAATCSL